MHGALSWCMNPEKDWMVLAWCLCVMAGPCWVSAGIRVSLLVLGGIRFPLLVLAGIRGFLAGPCWDLLDPCGTLLEFAGSLRKPCWNLWEIILSNSFDRHSLQSAQTIVNNDIERIFSTFFRPHYSFEFFPGSARKFQQGPHKSPQGKNRTQQIPQGFRKTQQLSTRPQPIPDGADQSKVVQGEIQQEKTISKKRQQQHASSYLYPVALWLEPTQAQANTQAQTQARAQAKITGRSHGPSQGPG